MKGMEESNVRHYFAKMVSAALLFGASEANAKKDMQDALEFEIELAYVQNEVKKIEKQREAKEASRKSGGDWRIHAKKAAKVTYLS